MMNQRHAAAIGMFDGVHLGHRHLLQQLKAAAAERRLAPMAVTFGAHPLATIAPQRAPLLLMSAEERLQRLSAIGVEVLALDFTPELSALTAREFMTMMHERHGVDMLMLGFNNRIGHDRLGSLSDYQAAGREVGVEVLGAEELTQPQGISSSAIRRLLSEGRVSEAAEMLGRPYALQGTVVIGRQLGRTIGFPTANISVEPADMLIPECGVYAGTACGHSAVINIGHRPTVDHSADAALSIEVHLLDFSADLYGSQLRVEFAQRLRSERKFSSTQELRSAIAADAAHVRKLTR
jgi:riboflavin kinase/FMN adenylyltransferase